MIIVYIIFLVKQNGLPFALEKVWDWVNLLLENQELLSGRSSLMHDTLDIFGQPYLWRNQTFKQRTVVRNVVESGCSILKQRKCWTSPFDWNRMSLRHFQKRTEGRYGQRYDLGPAQKAVPKTANLRDFLS